jgi:hypothetical protein
MNIYRISQNTYNGYDTFDSAVVIAPDELTAARIDPNSEVKFIDEIDDPYGCYGWINDPSLVTVEFIGVTEENEIRVVCSSYNAS